MDSDRRRADHCSAHVAEWCTRQQGTLRNAQRRQHGVPFSEQELARLSFVHWLWQSGRLDPHEHDTT